VNQAAAQQLQLHEPIGQGTFGVVFRATWRGIPSAVKLMQLPAAVGESLESAGLAAGAGAGGRGSSSREQMAVMEAAVGASINHPNVVQVRCNHRGCGQHLGLWRNNGDMPQVLTDSADTAEQPF
jgi:serine/threonine protein kinase